jgi:hypothetical protein
MLKPPFAVAVGSRPAGVVGRGWGWGRGRLSSGICWRPRSGCCYRGCSSKVGPPAGPNNPHGLETPCEIKADCSFYQRMVSNLKSWEQHDFCGSPRMTRSTRCCRCRDGDGSTAVRGPQPSWQQGRAAGGALLPTGPAHRDLRAQQRSAMGRTGSGGISGTMQRQ